MDIYTFASLCTDDSAEVRVYDMNPEIQDEVFCGTFGEAMYSKWENMEVLSFDIDPKVGIIINIDSSDYE